MPFQIVVGNVGDATVKGFDMELKALLGENFEIGGNFTIFRRFCKLRRFMKSRRPDRSGLNPQSQLPLFADQSSPLHAVFGTQPHGARPLSVCSTAMSVIP